MRRSLARPGRPTCRLYVPPDACLGLKVAALGNRSSQLERWAVVLDFELEAGRKHAAFEPAGVPEAATTVVADLSLSVSTSRSG